MATFTLSNINLQVDQSIFQPHHRKILKLQPLVQKTNKCTFINLKQPAEIISQKNLLWQQTVKVPAKYDSPILLEIHDQNQNNFGYNPEELQSVFQGSIIFNKKKETYCGWQVFCKNIKIGYLFANVEYLSLTNVQPLLNNDSKVSKYSTINQSKTFFGSSIEVNKNGIALTSIYAHFPLLFNIQKSRLYFQFQIGGQMQRSAIKRIANKQYKSFEVIQIEVNHLENTKLSVKVFNFDPNENKVKMIGHGTTSLVFDVEESPPVEALSLSERIKIQRVFLYHDSIIEIGWISFKYLWANNEKIDPKFFLQDKFTIGGDINFKPLKHSTVTISDPKKTIDIMSPLQSNSRIFVPKAQRFENFAKRKKCEQIGIFHQSVDLKDFPAHQSYRVPSFGFGKKIVPVERDHDVPGSGRYMLPSLFDRYK